LFKFRIRNLFEYLIVPIAIIGIIWALHSFAGYDLLTSTLAIVVALGAIAIGWLWYSNRNQQTMIEDLRGGIREHEDVIQKRMNALSANMATANDIEALSDRIELINNPDDSVEPVGKHIDASEFLRDGTVAALDDKEPIDTVSIEDDSKVIELDEAKRSLNKVSEENTVDYSEAVISNLITSESVCIYLQPKVVLLDNTVYGFEVLARLKDKKGNIIPAKQFMPLIQKPEIIKSLDNQVLEQTIKLMLSLSQKKQKPLMHVNISEQTFADEEAFTHMLNKLSAHKTLKNSLILEITEKVFEEINSGFADRIKKVTKTGFRFCIDHCGDASNAIRLIKSGMVTALKIDAKTFQALDHAATFDEAPNILPQAKKSDVKLIITHVEKQSQVIQLIDSNIEIAQGYIFSEPKPPVSENKADKSAAR